MRLERIKEDPVDLRSVGGLLQLHSLLLSPHVLPPSLSEFSREPAKFPVLCMFLETWRPASAAVLSGVFGCEVSVKNHTLLHL